MFNLTVNVGKRYASETDPEKIIKISMISFMVSNQVSEYF